MNFLKQHYVLIVIVIVAIFLRFYNLGTIPISLNHDETAIGYNAFSLLTTGKDEFGTFFPLSLKSFGDWKLPVYPWLTTLPIYFLGANEVAVRFASFVAGIVSIIFVYLIGFTILNKRSGLIAASLLTLSPWGIYFSRIAYEANVATAFFLAGLFCFILVYYYKKNIKLLYISSLLWGLTIFTYHAFVLFMPLFVFSLTLVMLFQRKMERKVLVIPSLIFLFFVALSAYVTLTQGSIGKLSSTSLFDDKNLINDRVNIFRGDNSGEHELLARLMHNKYSAVGYQIAQNYLKTYTPSFLFDKGGEKFLHNTGTIGNFYLIDIILMISGVIGLIYNRSQKLMPFYIWLIIGPIPSAITIDAPSSTRLFLILPLFILVMSYGVYFLFTAFLNKRYIGRFVLGALTIFYFVSVFYFIDLYFNHMNYQRAQFLHYGYKEAVDLSNKYKDYDVVMFGPENFPYISFLFYNKYSPVEFRKTAKYYPDNYGPFYYVKSFGRYSFVDDIDYENLKPKTLYIDYRGIRDVDYKILDPSGKPVFKYFFK